ncbi:lysozyme inhibitor LprI family protein [Sphingomonas hankookensis]|uniref:lysozyme inhibitor LprI family protein n=1 Tax=Sphingomonas hankookensis TaxID=563996 RepID=UPI001F58786E|nr:lysozyme inhibitor LprI family protein [Sphingomonas hankookensis]
MSIIIAALLLAAGNPCDGSATRDVEQCLAAELSRADAELNRYYAAATKRLTEQQDTAALAKLRTAELAWIAYRDAECDAVYQWWGQGTIRGAMALGCRKKVTEARTMVIWQNWLTYADSTQPILPKPRKEE